MDRPRPTARWFGRTSRRLSLQYSVLYMGLVLLDFLFAYFLSLSEMREWAQEKMQEDAARLQTIYDQGADDLLGETVDALSRLDIDRTTIYALFDETGGPVIGPLAAIPDASSGTLVSATVLGLSLDPHEEVDAYWVQIDRIGPWTLVQATSDEVIHELLEALVAALLLGFFLLLGLGYFLGNRVGRLTEDRVAQISDVLGRAASGDLAARINPRDRAADDLGQIEGGIDDALAKIEALMAAQRQVTVDVAHDLRSPMQRLRQRLERLAPSPDFDDEKAAGLASIDQIEHTFNALLTIADLENSQAAFDKEVVPLTNILDDLRDLYEEAAEAAGLGFRVAISAPGLTVLGNRSLILQMLGNLVENSIKYCPPGAEIVVSAQTDGAQLVLEVRDTGPGMAEEFIPHACDRFSREDLSRHIHGNGLGLAIVHAIAKGHGATVSLRNLSQGLCVTISGLSQTA